MCPADDDMTTQSTTLRYPIHRRCYGVNHKTCDRSMLEHGVGLTYLAMELAENPSRKVCRLSAKEIRFSKGEVVRVHCKKTRISRMCMCTDNSVSH
jgi:hypothetical protein